MSLQISQTRSIDQVAAVRHLGPTAEAFYQIFGLGKNNQTISTMDADGVSLLAIQALYEKVKENKTLHQKIEAYEEKN